MEMRLQVLLVSFLLLALLQWNDTHAARARISRRCKTYIRTRHTAQNEFDQTRTTTITPRCPSNQFIWYQPDQDHVITFKKSRKAFSICLNRDFQGMNIYQLVGTSKRLLVGSNATGDLGCFESECKHLTLLFEVEDSLKAASPSRVTYTYTSTVIQNKGCPKCTEVCQRACICSSQYVFVGKLEKSLLSMTSGLYTHYFKVYEFIKHNSLYNTRNQWLNVNEELTTTPQCENNNASFIKTYSPNELPLSTIPQYGRIKVYSKCPLRSTNTYSPSASYLISGNLTKLVIGGRSKERLIMCCGGEDIRHATNQLREMLLRQQCCSPPW